MGWSTCRRWTQWRGLLPLRLRHRRMSPLQHHGCHLPICGRAQDCSPLWSVLSTCELILPKKNSIFTLTPNTKRNFETQYSNWLTKHCFYAFHSIIKSYVNFQILTLWIDFIDLKNSRRCLTLWIFLSFLSTLEKMLIWHFIALFVGANNFDTLNFKVQWTITYWDTIPKSFNG